MVILFSSVKASAPILPRCRSQSDDSDHESHHDPDRDPSFPNPSPKINPPSPTQPKPWVRFPGGIDVFALLETSCETAVLRSAGRKIDPITNAMVNIADDHEKKPKDMKYENLKEFDLPQYAQGSFVERMHYFDVSQVSVRARAWGMWGRGMSA